MRKKDIIKVVDIMFFVLILTGTFYTLYAKYNFRIVFIYGMIDTILKSMLLAIMYLLIRIVFIKAQSSKLSRVDFKNDNYYRDILHEYSPAVLKYIDNFEYKDTTLIVILMGLKLKGIINDDLEIINNDFSKLDLNEKYICAYINKLKKIDIDKLKHTIIHDCKEYGLINTYKQNGLKEFPLNLSIKLITFLLIATIVLGFIHYMLIIMLVFTIIIVVAAYAVYNITVEDMNCMNPYKRTIKGEKINEKLEGLRKYLDEFSSLDTKSEDELIVWEDYLIYSVMFNQNDKIIREYQEKIDRM